MAGKSRKRRSKRGSHNNNNNSSNDASERLLTNSKDHTEQRVQVADNETKPNVETEQNQDGDIHLYTVPVKTQTGEKLELQLSLGDTVTSTRQFLLDAPETCFITCYELLLHTKDGCAHQLGDHNAISDVADITTGGCSLEMVPALYDDRSIRSHLHRTRELLSLSNLHASLSTSLALQNEVAPNKAANPGETTKTEIPELDALGWMEDVSGSLGNLLRSPSNDVKCVESMVFSSFNPPPGCRRLVGDLLYLDVITLEGNTFCVTGSSRMFFVNSSTMNTFDPRPIKASFEATTLVALLQKISPKFKKAFREILEQRTAAHPFENATSLLLPKSWLGLYPEHRRDSARAENSLTLLYGSEPIGIQRDWNEELQSCREFPHTSPQDRRVVHYCRILRDRALYKVTSGFVDAAINGAIGVISGCIPPINPTDPECFHMYVHNNIFFSFAVDADLEQLSKNSTDTSSEKRSTSSLHGSSEKSSELQDSSGVKNDGSSPEDLISDMEITQLAESEQATYASVNNDLKGTKAYQEADVPGLYILAMASIDYRGHRVVAQSVLPGILQGDKSDSLLYGSVDNGRKIYWNEDFHSKVSEAAKRLHLKEHSVLDGSGNVFKLAAPVECKGIVGGDDRHYLIDFLRVTPRDANYAGPGSRFCILRAELIAAFCQAKAAKESQSKKTNAEGPDNLAPASQNVADADKLDLTNEKKIEGAKELSSAPAEGSDQYDEIVFNPNVFTEFKLAGSSEEIAADENNVREVSLHLIDIVIPKFIQDLCTLEVSPMDGQTLTEALHAHGINVRYIGKVASGTKHLPHLWDLITNEIVVRSSKHIIKDVLRDTEDHDLAPAISHLFNCLFGSCQTPSGKATTNDTQSRTPRKELAAHQSRGKHYKRQARWKHRASLRISAPLHMNINSEALWSDIQEFAVIKYKFELPNDARLHVKKISVVRNLCQKVGITIAARKYDLNSTTPFQTSDVLDLHPVVKHSVPVCSEAKELVEIGKLQLAEGMLSEAYSLFSEAYSIPQQVTGPLHREVANCCRYLAMVLYHAGDMDGAISLQHRELIINERCLGLDHPDTAHSYGNMALFYHGLNQSELALHYMSRALHLLSLTSGPDHPDVAATFIKVAMMYQDIGKMDIALRYLQEALKKNEKLLGKEHIQTAVCYHALAIAFNHMGAFKLSHQHEKKTYDILVKQLGEDDSMTRDSQNWMNTFKMREIQMTAQQEKGQALNAASVQKTIHILQMSAQRLKGQALNAAPAQKAIYVLKAHPHLTPAFQAAALSVDSDVSANKPLNAAIIGGTLSNRRGIDERGTRAAAEVRKKAAARGLLVHPHGASAQALTPLTKLLNVINSGMTPDGVENGDADTVKKEENDLPLSDPTDAKNDQSKPVLEQPPVGLGKGLTSLNTKKQKSK